MESRRLYGEGIPHPGQGFAIRAVRLPARAPGSLWLGVGRGGLQALGCTLWLGTILAQLPVTADADGRLDLRFTMPNLPPGKVTLKVLAIDPGHPRGFAASNGVEVVIR